MPRHDRDVDSGAARGRGTSFRYGGDEFVVLLPNASLPEATATAERLRAEIARVGSEFLVTASVGVAVSDETIEGRYELIGAADEAAYVSKFTGRNRTTAWPLDPSMRERIERERAQARGR
jgi:diguanylate cyclase (GGDEF)-like protein